MRCSQSSSIGAIVMPAFGRPQSIPAASRPSCNAIIHSKEEALVAKINEARSAAGQPLFQYKTIPQGAATSVWAAVVADADKVGGRFCEDCHVAAIDDRDGMHDGVRSYALDAGRARALWALGEKLTNERY
jgi:hypothetical protein